MNNSKKTYSKFRILRKILESRGHLSFIGDLEELFLEKRTDKGVLRAKLWYNNQIMKLLFPFLINEIYWSAAMLKNYFKIAIRNLLKYKGYSFINIFGLATGLACSLLILLYVQDELSFNSFHKDKDSIYRVAMEFSASGQPVSYSAWTPPPVSPTILRDFPEIEYSARLRFVSGIIKYGDRQFREDNIIYAEPSFFDIFTFPFVKGGVEAGFNDPYTVIITEKTAEKYFGTEDPVGKDILYKNIRTLKVVGVLKDLPSNSQLQFDLLFSFSTLSALWAEESYDPLAGWWNHSYNTYIKISSEKPSPQLIDGIYNISKKYAGDQEKELGFQQRFYLVSLDDIYLRAGFNEEFGKTGNIKYLFIFSLIALFILAQACINYINLATARSAGRKREIGTRKVVGAKRAQLIRQMLGESVFTSSVSTLLAVILLMLSLPMFNSFTGKSLFIDFGNPITYLQLLMVATAVGLLSGIYPALILTAHKPVDIIKGTSDRSSKGNLLRKGLVVLQFTISIFLIVSTGLVSKQLLFMKDRNLGFSKEQILVLPLTGTQEARINNKILKNRFLENPAVLNVSATSSVPGDFITSRVVHHEDLPPEANMTMNILFADCDFMETYGVEMSAGRYLSEEIPTDIQRGFVLNKAAVKRFGWNSAEEALGKQFTYAGRKEGEIIGVMKDYHFSSLHEEIFPIVTHYEEYEIEYLSLRLSVTNISETLSDIKRQWEEILPNHPFEYFFLDDFYDTQYRTEEKVQSIFSLFTMLAVLIAALGLFAMASYMAERRTKEIGIRKVLGAGISNISLLLSKEFIHCVLAANILAWPLAWYGVDLWLQSFAYKISPGLSTFILAGTSAFAIALITVAYQTLRAARANPVDSLRYE